MEPGARSSEVMACDVAVCGGGLVGATLALALAELTLDVVLIEAHPFGTFGQPSFDDRTTALSNGSRRIFEALRVWPLLEREATAIRRIHISDRGRFGFARLDAAEQGLSALGFVCVNRAIGAALWRRLEESAVWVLAPAKVRGMQLVDGRQRIECDLGPQGSVVVETKLAIAADGAQSVLREAGFTTMWRMSVSLRRAHWRCCRCPKGGWASFGHSPPTSRSRLHGRTTVNSSRACRTPSDSVSDASCGSGRDSCIRSH